MNPRERVLAVAVGGTLLLIFSYLTYSYIAGKFSSRQAEIDRLEADIRKFKQQDLAGKLANKKIDEFAARSLPANIEVARTEYKNWLLSEIAAAGMTKPDVSHTTTVAEGIQLADKMTFSVTCRGTLPQVIDFLYAFYEVDWLHRISRLSLRPVKDDKALNVTMTIETLSLHKAKPGPLVERPGKRLALGSRDEYHKRIAHRNVYGPPNNAPQITGVSGSKDVYLGRSAELTLKGTDPDPLDKVRYKLLDAPDSDARLDEATGRLVWVPKAEGQFEFTVQAIDDGLPNLPSRPEKIVINVTRQPPPVARLDFDHASYTVLTGVLDLNGKGEIWLHNRPAGQTVVLHEGDAFQIGSIRGQVVEIGQYDFTFRADGKLRRLATGEPLDKAAVIPEPVAAAEGEPAPQPAATQPASVAPAPPASGDRAG